MKSILHARSGSRTGLRVCLAAFLGAALVALILGCGGASDGSAAGPHGGAGGGRGPGGGGRPGRGGDGNPEGSPSNAAAPQVPVIVEAVGQADMEAFLDASSTLMAEEAVGVVSQATGVAVELLVEEGDRVAEGRTLVRLAYEELELAERAASSDLEKLRADFQRAETLAREDLISDEEHQRLRFDFERAEIVWKQRALDLAHTRILAPISGTITERMVNVGQLVQRNETVFRLVDFDSLVAPVFVPEKYLASLLVGHKAVVRPRGLDEAPFDGKILRISPIVDSESGTVKVTIAIDRRAGLRPGMFANVQIVLDTHEDAVVLSKKALVFEDEQPHVFVVSDGVAQKRQLRLGYQDADRAEVTEGLAPGETVVVVGQSALKDGSAVAVQTADTENGRRAAAPAPAAAAEGSSGTESVP